MEWYRNNNKPCISAFTGSARNSVYDKRYKKKKHIIYFALNFKDFVWLMYLLSKHFADTLTLEM